MTVADVALHTGIGMQLEQMLHHQITDDGAVYQRIVTADIPLDPPLGTERQKAMGARLVADVALYLATDLQPFLERHVPDERQIS